MKDKPNIINRLRTMKHMTQEEFAEFLGHGATAQNVSDLERGKGKFHNEYFFKCLSEAFSTEDVKQLFELAGFSSYSQSLLAAYLSRLHPHPATESRDGPPGRYFIAPEELAPKDRFERDLISDLLKILRGKDDETKQAIAQNVRQFSKLVTLEGRVKHLEEILQKSGLSKPEEKKKTGS